MMRSLFSGVSGLKNHQTRMDVIGNNISNVNTTGFKSSRVAFTDILSQNLQGASAPNGNMGGTNPKQIGLGSAVGAVDLLFTNGSVQSTGVNTDLALSSANALFILDTGSGTAYTRNGDFQFDADGNYVQAGNGYFVQGWMANNGTIDTGSQVSNITIPSGKTMAPTSSTTAVYTNNLNAEVPTIVNIKGGTVTKTGTDIYTKKEEGSLTGTEEYPVRVTTGGASGPFSCPGGSYTVGDSFTIGINCEVTSGAMTASTANPVGIVVGGGNSMPARTSGTYEIGKKFSTEVNGETMKATPEYPVTVTVGGSPISPDPTSGTYTVGGQYTAINSGASLTGSTTYPVTVVAGGTTFMETSGTYTVGTGTYTTTTDGQKMTATNTATVDVGTEDGGAYTIKSGSQIVGQNYTADFKSVADGSVTKKDTNTITLTLSDGTTVDDASLTTGTAYKVGDTYGTQTIQSMTSVSKITSLTAAVTSASQEITKLEAEIVNLSQTITQLEQDYAEEVDASADSPATIKLSDGSSVIQTSGKYTVGHSLPIITTLSIYDTLGSVHDLPVYFTLTNAENDTWSVALTNDGTNSTSWKEADGSTTTVTMDASTLDFDTNGAYAAGTGKPTITLTNGATTPQTIQLDFTQLTQYSSSSTIAGKADGNSAGTLSSISIDKTGTITGTYTNGMKQTEAQVALQRFTNPGGLTKVGESLYEDSNNAGKSGEPSTAATLGATITPAALEMSNVDVANEFTDMIITQRGFQSNSKIITTSDEMLETLINLKR